MRNLLAPAIFFAVCGWAVESRAAEEPQTVTGLVTATLNDAKEVAAVTIKADDDSVYAVKLDDNAKCLAADMNGRRAAVTGHVADSPAGKTITVVSYRSVTGDGGKTETARPEPPKRGPEKREVRGRDTKKPR